MRAPSVVEIATKEAGWGRKLPPGRGLGLAAHYSFVSYVAAVVEVELSKDGRLLIPRVDIAFDCGPQVNEDRVRSQLEGSVIMGVSLATLGLPQRYGARNPFAFLDLQDVQEVTNFFERRVSAYQVGVSGDVVLDGAF